MHLKRSSKKLEVRLKPLTKKREQSKQLLEIAKIGVKRAIETDEATATDWIDLQLEALGVSLT
jgi:type I restriction enzyme M protein